jgi:ribonuclease HII
MLSQSRQGDGPDLSFESKILSEGARWLAGVDEVGRGALAGPVVAAAAAITPPLDLYERKGIKDSKLLSPIQRERIDIFLRTSLPCWSFGEASVEEIARLNIREATFLAMKRALSGLPIVPDLVLVDGREAIPGMSLKQRAIPSGDRTVFIIAAASILAKVYRDRLMVDFDDQYQGYSFSKNKGYGTQEHRNALISSGLSPLHRVQFCQTFLSSNKNRSLFPEDGTWTDSPSIS